MQHRALEWHARNNNRFAFLESLSPNLKGVLRFVDESSPTFTRMTWRLPKEEKHTLTSPGSFLAAGLVLPLCCSNTGYLCFIETTTGEKIGEIPHINPTCIAPVSDNLFVISCLESFSLMNLEHLREGPLWTIHSPEVASLTYLDGHILVCEGEFSGAKVTVYTKKGNKVKTLSNPPGKCIIGHFENERKHTGN
ncbi:hypothetical protein Pelo_2108 [Pelomyxa schiedti]|nr:hypothetical protein Pelo_2108 [Pelomyxa schiedti]